MKESSNKEIKDQPNLPSRFVLTSFDLSYLNFEKFPWAKNEWEKHLQNILEIKRMSDTSGAEFLFLFWGGIFQILFFR